jgi:hypothetical protein
MMALREFLRHRGAAFVPVAIVGLLWTRDDLAADQDAKGAPAQLRFEWRYVLGKHWQIVSPPGEDPAVTDAAEGNRGACPVGMIEVQGKMKTAGMMDELQKQYCTKWINRNFPERCAQFDKDRWLAASKSFPTRDMHFCIDRYEFPNRKGEYPLILINWVEAGDLCKSANKRLCSENEWTFACEGEEARPYPYGDGYTRDANACVVDATWRPYNPVAFAQRDGDPMKAELDKLWQGTPSGQRTGCKSVFGVYDMTGNIDEWTKSSQGGRPSVLKGGYWGPVRTRCRPSTRAHGEMHVFYQQGVRCCADLP